MTLPAPVYDLVLLLDPQAEDGTRAKIVSDTVAAIQGDGELLRQDAWGERPLTYPIERRATAEYHLFQFHAGSAALLAGLDRTLRITDGVLRFRIIKLEPGTPSPPDLGSAGSRRAEQPSEPPGAAETPVAETPVAETPAAATAAADAPAAAETPPAPETEAAPVPEAAVTAPAE